MAATLSGEESRPLMTKDQKQAISDDTNPVCILCVGSTGTGKSSTISKVTRLPIASNSGTNRVTSKCAMYKRPSDREAWIDTVGFDDASLHDQDTFKDILRFIDTNYMTKIKAVVWNVHPNVRADKLLCKQAALIDRFAPKEIWNNCIIIVKQSMSPDDDGRGAMRAALDFNAHANVQLLGYRYLDDETFSDKQKEKFLTDEASKEAFNVMTDDEVREAIADALVAVGDPVQVVFRNSRCVDCGARGDERLMSKYCHMQSTLIHTGISEDCHPGHHEAYHNDTISYCHHGRLLVLPNALGGHRYTCCYRKAEKRGCLARWRCCSGGTKDIGCRTRFNCCGTDIAKVKTEEGCQKRFACCRGRMSDEGCTKVCKKCDRKWGLPADECYKKKHNVIEVDSDDDEDFLFGKAVSRTDDSNLNIDNEEDSILQKDHHQPPVILIHVI